VTEGTTRLLETPERPAASFDQNVYEQPGSLAQAATTRISPQANPTNRNLETNPKTNNRMVISLMLAATIVLILAGLFIALRNRSATIPAAPAAPGVTGPEAPPVQPPPPPPLPSPATTQGGSLSHALVYPGAKTLMEVSDASEGNVLQLQTSDSLDNVVAWYTEKLKPTKVIRAPGSNIGGADSNVILVAGEVKVIINAEGGQTTIMLAQGGD
jgi:hypothetical protein